MRWILEKVAKIDRRRILPKYEQDHFRRWFERHEPNGTGNRGPVVLLDDCFTTFNEPRVGIAAVRVLEAAGYRVELAGLSCCGRPAHSKGLLPIAQELAESNVRKLAPIAAKGIPVVGIEPSCTTMLMDEYRDMKLGADVEIVAGSTMLIDTFIANRCPDLRFRETQCRALLHGHCQQKALVGTSGTISALSRIPGLSLQELDSGCCGMAGSFGYELGHYEVSEALANRVLLPAIKAEPNAMVIAPGFSCRSQLHGLAGVNAKHPIEVLAEAIM